MKRVLFYKSFLYQITGNLTAQAQNVPSGQEDPCSGEGEEEEEGGRGGGGGGRDGKEGKSSGGRADQNRGQEEKNGKEKEKCE